MDVATMKKDLENQIGSINEDLKNIYLPLEAVLILLGKRTAFEIALELIDSLQQEMWKPSEEQMEIIFPELLESKDERIRRILVESFEKANCSKVDELVDCRLTKGKILAWLEKQKEQKVVYEDEYQRMLSDSYKCGKDEVISNPEKYGLQKEQKPTEWSEEDEDMLNSCISSIEEAKENRYAYKETDGDTSYDHEIAWLKSLRPQPHWKPSEEQMDRLSSIIAALRKDYCDDMADFLASIYHNLKKLM